MISESPCLAFIIVGMVGMIPAYCLVATLISWNDFKASLGGLNRPYGNDTSRQTLSLAFRSQAGYIFAMISFIISILGIIAAGYIPSELVNMLLPMSAFGIGLLLPIFVWLGGSIVNDIVIQLRWTIQLLRDVPPNTRYFSAMRKGEYWVHWKYTPRERKEFIRLLIEHKLEDPRGLYWIIAWYLISVGLQAALEKYVNGLPGMARIFLPLNIFIFILWNLYDGRLPRGFRPFLPPREVYIGPLGIWIPGVTHIFFDRPGDVNRWGKMSGSETFMRVRWNRTWDTYGGVSFEGSGQSPHLNVEFTRPEYRMSSAPIILTKANQKMTIVLDRTQAGLVRGGFIFFIQGI
jgi:hypothetical protein